MEDPYSLIIQKENGRKIHIVCWNFLLKHFNPPSEDKTVEEITIPILSLQEAKERGWMEDRDEKWFCPECAKQLKT